MPEDPNDPRRVPRPFRPLLSGRADPTPLPVISPPSPAPWQQTAPPRPPLAWQTPAPPTPPLAFLQPYLEGAGDIARGATIGATGPEDTWLAKGTELLGAALPVVGGAKTALTGARAFLPGTRGLYSRVDDALARLPAKGAHPNKVASLLKSSASQEEIAHRRIPEFLAAKGNQTVTPAELQAHLAANPAPVPSSVTLGEPHDEYGAMVDRLSEKYGVGFNGDMLTPEERSALTEAWNETHQAPYRRPKYGEHTLAGGENYREHLYTLPRGEDPVPGQVSAMLISTEGGPDIPSWHRGAQVMSAEQAERLREAMRPHGWDVSITPFMKERAQYESPHFDPANIVAHARSKERTLPPSADAPATLPEGYSVVRDQLTGGYYYRKPGMISRPEYPTEEAGIRAAMAHAGTAPAGPRGRFLEEVQSDWHQAGKKQGYQSVDAQQRHANAVIVRNAAIERAREYRNTFLERHKAAHPYEPMSYEAWQEREILPEFRGPEFERVNRDVYAADMRTYADSHSYRTGEDDLYADPTYNQLRQAVITAEDALTTARRSVGLHTVPDAPFKETWPDLVLKQQLLDVAHDPKLSWLGFTSGKTQADRYDLAKYVGRLEYDPAYRRLFGYSKDNPRSIVFEESVDPEEFASYIGKEPSAALQQKVEQYHKGREWERQQWSIAPDPEAPGKFNVVDPNGEIVHNELGMPMRHSESRAQDYINRLMEEERGELPAISGLDLQIGGEGMTQFYDQLLPARLNKILAPFGGKVERGAVPTGEGYRILNQEGEQLARYDNLITAQQDLQQMQRLLQNRTLRLVGDEEPAWIAQLSPEMKAAIRKGGLPLMALLLGLAPGMASEPVSSPGAPPVPAPPEQPPH